ncbi:MAG: hypothetical protein JJE53_03215 [Candidatus Pacebacteria bacterium]|nr:hypothetical protein [Candidatus Paceibacterota bacterium]
MDIKELDKKQLILLTLLITFVVSIGTGIVTVSLMNQAPEIVPQTINNVIQRTIEKITTVQVPAPLPDLDNKIENQPDSEVKISSIFNNGDALVNIYLKNINEPPVTSLDENGTPVVENPAAIGQGIIISDVGLILVDSSLINDQNSYKVVLDKTDFDVLILKKFNNGFTVLKISPISDKNTGSVDSSV